MRPMLSSPASTPRTGSLRVKRFGRRSRDGGIGLLWTAVCLVVFIGFTGLAIDGAVIWYVAHQLQNGADASSLAGALRVRRDTLLAREMAIMVGQNNRAAMQPIQIVDNPSNDPDGDVVIGRWMRGDDIFTPTLVEPNAVQVRARRVDDGTHQPVPLFFVRIFGITQADVWRDAIARVRGDIGTGVIILDPDLDCSFDMRGTPGLLSVEGAAVFVDSNNPAAACHSGQPTIDTEEIYVTGDTDKHWEKHVDYEGDIYYGTDPIGDPLKDLPEPTWDPSNINPSNPVVIEGGITETITAGYYPGGITVHNGTLNMEPGIYIVEGAGFWVNGGNVNAPDGVMIFVHEGPLNLEGNGIIDIVAPTEGDYAGIAFFQARDNFTPGRVLGTNNFSLDGMIYMQQAHLEIGGTSDSFSTGLIVDTLQSHGDGLLEINYKDQLPRIPPWPFIVE